MSPEMIGLIGFGLLFFLMALGMPIGFAMAGVGAVGFVYLGGLSGGLTVMGTSPYSTVGAYEMAVLPLFILMGNLAFASGITGNVYSFAHKWFSRLPGGLAMGTIGACAGFAACTGSSTAGVSVFTSTALPEMMRYKYDPRLAAGSIASGSTLGILIPPSVPFIIYGIIAQESVGRLFLAGVLPGILLTTLFLITIFIWVKIRPSMGPPGPGASWREKMGALRKVWPAAVLSLIVLLGIWGGIFTSLEAGGVGAFVAFVMMIILKRKVLNRQFITEVLISSLRVSVMIFTILIGAMIFNYFLALSNLPKALAEFAGTVAVSPTVVLLAIMSFYLVGGCLMDALGLSLLSWPIFVPIMTTLGVNLILFGVLTVVMIEMACITPPVGMNVFVLSGMCDIPMYTIFRGIFPFLMAMMVCVALLIAFPEISLFLPSTMIK
jgi:tripartite ATP-independent transporter DctM subunit